MPIRWSAGEVSDAMDDVEKLLDQAEPILAEAEQRARKATGISNLPDYMTDRLQRLIYTIKARDRMKDGIDGIRKDIPQDALAADRGPKTSALGL